MWFPHFLCSPETLWGTVGRSPKPLILEVRVAGEEVQSGPISLWASGKWP